jgi:hypothetical protein
MLRPVESRVNARTIGAAAVPPIHLAHFVVASDAQALDFASPSPRGYCHDVAVAARKKFTSRCGQPTNQWRDLGAVVEISGVGFFDIPHTQKPHALNFAELHLKGVKTRIRG